MSYPSLYSWDGNPSLEETIQKPLLWTESGTVPSLSLVITAVGCGFRMPRYDVTVCDNTAQLYHTLGFYRLFL